METKKNKVGFAYGLGDWCEIMSLGPTTSLTVTDTLICYRLCKKAEFVFNLLGMNEELEYTSNLSEQIYKDFRNVYITPIGLCLNETQTAYSLLLAYDMLTEDESRNAIERLVYLIHWNRDKMKVGILGAREIFHVLSKYNYHDLAYKMIVDKDFPSYGELVEKGFTSLSEKFLQTEVVNGELKTATRQSFDSLNHHMFSDVSHWFFENILGIHVNPKLNNPKHIVIKPCQIESISYSNGTYENEGETLFVKWERKAKGLIIINVTNCGNFNVELNSKGYCVKKLIDNKEEKTFELIKKS